MRKLQDRQRVIRISCGWRKLSLFVFKGLHP
jgi:hypothetical protein